MAETLEFKGFGGVRLEAETVGDAHAPIVLLLHGSGQSRAAWRTAAVALVAAGRRAISLDLRGHGGSEWPADGRYDLDAFVADLRLVLAQLRSRPVIVASTLGAVIALAALAEEGANLAAGLVVADLPTKMDAQTTARVRERLRDGTADESWDKRVLDSLDIASTPERIAIAAPALKLPVLVLRGTRGEETSEGATRALAEALPDAEVFEIAGAGRLLSEQHMDAFNAALLDFLERRQPRAASEFRSGTDVRTLRDALGCFATGITIVTTMADEGTPVGLTANSFTSLSLDPPLLLVCIANDAGSATLLRHANHFAVNVLQIGQQPASNRFASKAEDRFAGLDWAPGEQGAPVLAGSLGSFECERFAVHEGGDHFILIGHVRRATFEPRRDPLLYFRGKYRRLHFA